MQTTTTDSLFRDWQEGYTGPFEALRGLTAELSTVEAALAPLERRKAELRERIAQIVTTLDKQRAELPGVGTLALTGGGVRTSWDTKALDALQRKLVAHGYAGIAEELLAARKEAPVAPALRITKEKV